MTKEEKHQLSCIEQKHRDGELRWQRREGSFLHFTTTIADCLVRVVYDEGGLTMTDSISPSSTYIGVFVLRPGDKPDAPTEDLLWEKHELASCLLFGVALFGRVTKFWNTVRKTIEQEEREAHAASVAEVSARICQPA